MARIPVLFLVRTFALAAVAVGLAGYAVVRYYTHPRVPNVEVPAPGTTSSYDADAGLIEAPEIEPAP